MHNDLFEYTDIVTVLVSTDYILKTCLKLACSMELYGTQL